MTPWRGPRSSELRCPGLTGGPAAGAPARQTGRRLFIPTSPPSQAITTEGKYWKSRIEFVVREYHKWRTYFKKRVSGRAPKRARPWSGEGAWARGQTAGPEATPSPPPGGRARIRVPSAPSSSGRARRRVSLRHWPGASRVCAVGRGTAGGGALMPLGFTRR